MLNCLFCFLFLFLSSFVKYSSWKKKLLPQVGFLAFLWTETIFAYLQRFSYLFSCKQSQIDVTLKLMVLVFGDKNNGDQHLDMSTIRHKILCDPFILQKIIEWLKNLIKIGYKKQQQQTGHRGPTCISDILVIRNLG